MCWKIIKVVRVMGSDRLEFGKWGKVDYLLKF